MSLLDKAQHLIDKDGFKTEVTITLTDTTLVKIVGGLLATGVGIAFVSHLFKNAIPNKQLKANNGLLKKIAAK